MESALIEACSSQCIWGILFVFLFLYTIKNSEKRENKYQSLLENFSKNYDLLLNVKESVDKIETEILSTQETGKEE